MNEYVYSANFCDNEFLSIFFLIYFSKFLIQMLLIILQTNYYQDASQENEYSKH